MKNGKKSKMTAKQAKDLIAQGHKATKAAKKALLNVGAKDPGGIYQRLLIRRDSNTLIDHNVWQLYPDRWSSDAFLLLLVEARNLAAADSYVNMGLLFGIFGLNTKLVGVLLKKYPEHTPIYDDIKCGVRDRLLQGALEGTYDKYISRFALECNHGMRAPELELAPQAIEIKMSVEAEEIMAETERLDAMNAVPAVALLPPKRGRGRPPKKGGSKTAPKSKRVGATEKDAPASGAKTAPKSKDVDAPEKTPS